MDQPLGGGPATSAASRFLPSRCLSPELKRQNPLIRQGAPASVAAAALLTNVGRDSEKPFEEGRLLVELAHAAFDHLFDDASGFPIRAPAR